MKPYLSVLLMVMSMPSAYSACMDTASTQQAMNACANVDYAAADKKLNEVYQQIQVKYKADPTFLQKLQKAQKAWLVYRDAQIDLFYPHRAEPHYYGSILNMCIPIKLQILTEERTKMLTDWLTYQGEGDDCSGSVGAL